MLQFFFCAQDHLAIRAPMEHPDQILSTVKYGRQGQIVTIVTQKSSELHGSGFAVLMCL